VRRTRAGGTGVLRQQGAAERGRGGHRGGQSEKGHHVLLERSDSDSGGTGCGRGRGAEVPEMVCSPCL